MTSIMKEPNPNATIQIGAVDLGEGPDKVSLEDAIAKAKGRKTQPPPLPEEYRASHPPAPPAPPSPSPPASPSTNAAPPAGRGPFFYIAILLGVVIVGVIGGTLLLRATTKPPAKPPASPSVITIPTVEVE